MSTAESFTSPEAAGSAPATGTLAGFGRRLGAYLLDALIVLAVFGVLFGGLYAIAGEGAATLGYVLSVIFGFFYAPVLMARGGEHNGQTWGKQALGIRAVRDAGGAMTFGTGAVREMLGKGLLGVFVLPTLASLVMVIVRDDKKAIHDLIAGTHVTRA